MGFLDNIFQGVGHTFGGILGLDDNRDPNKRQQQTPISAPQRAYQPAPNSLEKANPNLLEKVGDAISDFSIPDSVFDPVRSLTMHKSDLQNYQWQRDKQLAEHQANNSSDGTMQAYGSYSPYIDPPPRIQ